MQVLLILRSIVCRRWSILALAMLITVLLNSLTLDAQDKQAFPKRHASGTVVDVAGKPVKGATVYNYSETVTTDEDGKFRLEYQQSTLPYRNFLTWVFAEGYGVRTVNMGAKFQNKVSIENVKIQLPKTESYKFRIVTPDSKPFSNQSVRISSVDIPNGMFAADEPTGTSIVVPKPVDEFTQSRTDEDGVVVFERFPKQLVSSFEVETPKWGSQVFSIGSKKTRYEFKLKQVGSIEGVIHAKDPKQYDGCKIFVGTDSFVLGSNTVVEVDSDGKFNIPAIVCGDVHIRVAWPKGVDVYLLKQSTVLVKPGEVTNVESESEPVRLIQVSGVVLTDDTRKPIVGASVLLKDVRGRYGSQVVQTNEFGEYSAKLCEGSIDVHVVAPGNVQPGKYDFFKHIVMELSADGDESIQLPELLARSSPQKIVKGRVVDSDGEAIPDATVVLATDNFTFGRVTTSEQGEFEMPIRIGWNRDPGTPGGPFFALQFSATQFGKLPTLERLELLNEDNDVFNLQRSK